MKMRNPSLILIFSVWGVFASIHDCWDDEKLRRMNVAPARGGDSGDPALSKFSNLVKCLSQEQSKTPGNQLDDNWGKWSNVAKGQFLPSWQNKPTVVPLGNNWPTGMNENHNRAGESWPAYQQPKPGVHPDDWGRSPSMDSNPDSSWTRRGKPADPPPGWSFGQETPSTNFHERKPYRERDEVEYAPGRKDTAWNPPPPIEPIHERERDYVMITNDDTTALSLSRKYGYAIMVLSVVVLAVLMVATIFCCSSSNSTMSQPANQHQVPIGPFDTFSIYSYKGGGIGGGGGVGAGLDTLRSTGTLGGMSLHTETLKSSRSIGSRSSPQYRVSDIDPEFVRRFEKENIHY